MSKIILSHLTKIYNEGQNNEVRALNDVSFEVDEGEFLIILGASGAGKSTLLNILGGMDNASSGSYHLGEKEIVSMNAKALQLFRREDIGFVFQFYNLMPNLTALENVELAASVAKAPLNPKETLQNVGLSERLNNFPSQLSGGEQQRVAIARALVKNPTLLLCDEPTGALDSKTGASIIALLHEAAIKYHKSVIIVTHNAKIASCASRVIHIRDGKLESDEVNSNPLSPLEIEW